MNHDERRLAASVEGPVGPTDLIEPVIALARSRANGHRAAFVYIEGDRDGTTVRGATILDAHRRRIGRIDPGAPDHDRLEGPWRRLQPPRGLVLEISMTGHVGFRRRGDVTVQGLPRKVWGTITGSRRRRERNTLWMLRGA